MIRYKVTRTEEREQLESLVSLGKWPARKLPRARMLLLADKGVANKFMFCEPLRGWRV